MYWLVAIFLVVLVNFALDFVDWLKRKYREFVKKHSRRG